MPGTGLPLGAYVAVVAASVALFLFWGEPIWSAPRESSHVARFVVSYLAVIPLASAALALLRRFSVERVVTTTGTAWAIKLVITAVLYQAFARGTATQINPVKPHASTAGAAAAQSADYHPAGGAFSAGQIRGRVTHNGSGAAGAIVFVKDPPPGAPLKSPERVELVLKGMRYAEPAYLAHTADDVILRNADHVLHTVHLYAGTKSIANQPLPPSGEESALRLPDPGVYTLRCDTHSDERASLVVVDHPYAARADRDGAFVIAGAPSGSLRIAAAWGGIDAGGAGAGEDAGARLVDVPSGGSAEVLIDMGSTPTGGAGAK